MREEERKRDTQSRNLKEIFWSWDQLSWVGGKSIRMSFSTCEEGVEIRVDYENEINMCYKEVGP